MKTKNVDYIYVQDKWGYSGSYDQIYCEQVTHEVFIMGAYSMDSILST